VGRCVTQIRMNVVAGVTIVPLLLFMGVAFVWHPGRVLIRWTRLGYALCLLAAQAAAILLPLRGTSLCVAHFVAGANMAVEGNELFVCAATLVLLVLETGFLEIAATYPINYSISLLSVAFFLCIVVWTLVRHRRRLFGSGFLDDIHPSSSSSPQATKTQKIVSIVFNWVLLLNILVIDVLVPTLTQTSNADPILLVAVFVLGRNSDVHRPIFSPLALVLTVASAINVAFATTSGPAGLACVVPLAFIVLVFTAWERPWVGGAGLLHELVLVASSLAWAGLLSFAVFVVCTRPPSPLSPTASLALAVVAIVLLVVIALVCVLVAYADEHARNSTPLPPPLLPPAPYYHDAEEMIN
jgi:hypothetical protein